MPILLSFYFWRSTTSAAKKRATDNGKNMYANWNINYASEKHLGVHLLKHCGKYGEYGTYFCNAEKNLLVSDKIYWSKF